MSIHTWEITLLTPLHIGDGRELQRNLDFSAQANRLNVIDMEAFFETLQEHPQAIREIGRSSFDPLRFAKDYRFTLPWLYELPLISSRSPDNLRHFIKDATHRPYLPGSTLKGALRTALQAGFDRSRLPHLNAKGKDAKGELKRLQKAVQQLNGKDPHHDFLRLLTVSDSHSLSPEGSLQADEIKFFNLRRNNQAGWKDFKSKKTFDSYREAAGVHVESLKSGVTLWVRVELDEGFLSTPHIQRLAGIPRCTGLHGFEALCQAVNQHSLALAQAEYDFFNQYRPEGALAAAAYQNIGAALTEAVQHPGNAMYLRIAWGSGWRGMTGNWLKEDQLTRLREVAKLGKMGAAVFPKTRRLALKDGIPCLPPGWVQIVFQPAADFLHKAPVLHADSTPNAPVTVTVTATAAELTPDATIRSPETARPQTVPPPVQPVPEPETEIWHDVLVIWNAGGGGFAVISGPDGKTATLRGRQATEALIPAECHDTLFKRKKRQMVLSAVTVTPLGGKNYQPTDCKV